MTNAYNPGPGFTRGSPYGDRIDPFSGNVTPHAGQDFVAKAGTPIPAAASGRVVYSGRNDNLGNAVIVKNHAGGYSLYAHMLDGKQVGLGQLIWQGDTVGLVGSTGARTTGNHLHYSVITDEAGKNIKSTNKDGSIGILLNDKTTLNPTQYDNYDPTPRYLDETRRVAQIMSGPSAGVAPPVRSDPLGDRFRTWGNAPAGIPPLVPSDSPESFHNRYGNWGSVPAGSFGDAGSSATPGDTLFAAATPTSSSVPSDNGNSPSYVFDPTKPPPPFSPSNYASAYRSIDRWIASLAGVEPGDPAEFSPPPIFSPLYRR
jgi:murein DD-endopeptidase MepM/ murein hydrolase activator NlpD